MILAAALVALAAEVAAEPSPLVRARLVSDAASLEGAELRLGVVLEMAPEWHVYWVNPGDAGLATEVELGLPEGWSAGSLQWPTPVGFPSPGGIQSYGYGDEVVLTAPVRLPVSVTAPATVRATVSWLACRDRCELGGAELELALPVAPEEAASARVVLDRWRALLPVDARSEPPPFSLRSVGGLGDGLSRGTLSIWLGWPEDPGAVELYPAPPESLGVSAVQARTRGQLTRIDGTLERLGDGERPASFPAVVVQTAADGSRRAWQVDVPLPR